jgi:hypothetical protein
MQTCSKCYALSADTTVHCSSCQADLRVYSTTAVALERFQANPRVHHLILSINDNACPVCKEKQGAYLKNEAPVLPIEGCSHPHGCRCFYQPVLEEIYP